MQNHAVYQSLILKGISIHKGIPAFFTDSITSQGSCTETVRRLALEERFIYQYTIT